MIFSILFNKKSNNKKSVGQRLLKSFSKFLFLEGYNGPSF